MKKQIMIMTTTTTIIMSAGSIGGSSGGHGGEDDRASNADGGSHPTDPSFCQHRVLHMFGFNVSMRKRGLRRT